ncbi:3-oxoacyl-ACP reductase [Sphingorhabdus lutea]|uniref:3-oxoacyl-ACP reductase n=1 Tax=Sphingorhabdus lutea TaxID=1913578 RepID=A0A1L3JA97_9SPHN|nr:glucose 1-dehydrogenase [Sphingorhabdus lutea]APG62039.1 3-oxoacyl-ACP reductase [Sphingorhabdus lutea]
MPANLDGHIAIVTGGADGIGRAIVELFCEQGARVCIADVNAELAIALADEICAKGQNAFFAQTNIADKDSVNNMVDAVVNKYGPPSILINNAGIIVVTKDPLENSEETWKRIFAINLEGMWNCARAVIPYMKKAKSGSIVNLGSVHSFQIVPGHFPYAITKHAVIGLTRSLAVEYGADNIRVNTLCPGMVETPTALKIWSEMDDPEAVRKAVGDIHPLKRNASPKEMAYPALFLASDESSFMTGQSLIVDGGRSALYSE